MLVELILLVLACCIPIAVGFALARQKPELSAWKVAGLAALPMFLCFLALAVWMRSMADAAPFWLGAVAVFGVISLLIGFGLGMVGHAMGSGGRKV